MKPREAMRKLLEDREQRRLAHYAVKLEGPTARSERSVLQWDSTNGSPQDGTQNMKAKNVTGDGTMAPSDDGNWEGEQWPVAKKGQR